MCGQRCRDGGQSPNSSTILSKSYLLHGTGVILAYITCIKHFGWHLVNTVCYQHHKIILVRVVSLYFLVIREHLWGRRHLGLKGSYSNKEAGKPWPSDATCFSKAYEPRMVLHFSTVEKTNK